MHSDSVIATETTQTNVVSKGRVRKIAYMGIKRAFDIFVGIVGIICIVPLAFIIKAVSICNRDYNSIFFKQKRLGKNGEVIYIYKFRTMVPNAEEVLNKWLQENEEIREEYYKTRKIENDPRITKIGNILRVTSLDEFPQFINIFKGDMSFIGPRPVVLDEADNYGVNKAKFLSMRPGLTGYWAANGRSNLEYDERMKMELYYIDNCSIKLDIKIIISTVLSVIKRDGAK